MATFKDNCNYIINYTQLWGPLFIRRSNLHASSRTHDIFFCEFEMFYVRYVEAVRDNGGHLVTRSFPSELVVLTTVQHFEMRESFM